MLRFDRSPRLAILVAALFAAILAAASSQAQIVRDDTTGQTPGALIPDVNDVFEIDGSDGIRRGANSEFVIHSMSEFNLGTNETARYTDDAAFIDTVTNVLTRVTGGAPSSLDGRLESLYPNADLIFVNPNGVFFGANFTIDVPKSFNVSTADILEWEAGVDIDTTGATDIPVLTAPVPMAWRFLGAGPEKRIDVEGFSVEDSGTVLEDEAFSFVGSELVIGTSAAPIEIESRGRNVLAIALGDTGSIEGLFDFESPFYNQLAILPTNGFFVGDLEFNGTISTTGEQAQSGDIAFWGGRTEVNGSLISRGSLAQSNPDAGILRLLAGDLLIDGVLDSQGVLGDGGNVFLQGRDRIDFAPGTQLLTGAQLAGMFGGNIQIFPSVATRMTGQDFVFNLGSQTDAQIGQLLGGADIIDFVDFQIIASASDVGRTGGFSLSGRQIRLEGIGPNSIDLNSAHPVFGGGGFTFSATEFIDFRDMTINASASGGGNGGFISIDSPQVTTDANFLIDVSAAPAGSDGTVLFQDAMPVVTANPPPIDPPPSSIFRDDTDGQTAGEIVPIGDVYTIDGTDGIRRDGGEIVIHSFDRFSLQDFETALFTDDPFFLDTVVDVFTRVTGGQSSNIAGTIESAYTLANLTFINSNGVIFADGFTLDTAASFIASTADQIEFESGLLIDLNSADVIPSLDTEFALRWNFMSSGPEKRITINDLNVALDPQLPEGSTLAFFGGDVTFDMNSLLQTQGHDLLAVAVGTAGSVDFFPEADRAALTFTPNGDLTLNLISGQGNNTTGLDGGTFGGDISLIGGSVEIMTAPTVTLGTGLDTEIGPRRVDNAGDIFIVANDFLMQASSDSARLSTEADGLVGSTVIDAANSMTFGDDVRFFSRGFGSLQDGGDVELIAGDSIAGNLQVFASASGSGGQGGSISLSAETIDLADVRLSTGAGGGGTGGDVSILGRQIVLDGNLDTEVIGISSISTGINNGVVAGSVLIDALENLDITDLTIDASSIGIFAGDGGFVEINAAAATADDRFDVDVSSALGNPGTFTGTAFPSDRIIRDATAGQIEGPISPSGDVYEINGNDGIRRGANDTIVVHSFDRFGLEANETAEFTDDPGFLTSVTDVLTRVTGPEASQIDGTIRNLYENANLFFANPLGLFFGGGFVLDTNASFFASAADSLDWDPAATIDFNSTADIPVLTGSQPLRWNFAAGGGPKEILIDGIEVFNNGGPDPDDDSVSFVGGNLTLNGDLDSIGRNVEFFSVGSAGSIDVDPLTGPILPPDGTITIAGDIATTTGDGFSGDVLIWGGIVDVSGAIDTATSLQSPQSAVSISEDVEVFADTFQLTGSINTRARAESGAIRIETFDSSMFTGAQLSAEALGDSGLAGDIIVNAGGSLMSTDLTVTSDALGADSFGGVIELRGDLIGLQDLAVRASAPVEATPGSILIDGQDVALVGTGANSIDVSSVGMAAAGGVIIDGTDSLDFQNLTINASNTGADDGNGGFVQVDSLNGTSDAFFDVDVSSATGVDGTITGSFFGPGGVGRIVRDATTGQIAGPIDSVSDVYEIDGRDGLRRGGNDEIVVHSFERFDLEEFETARYTDDPGFLSLVTNVLTRVTGDQPSQLDGLIESLYTNADLFFANPNGVIFGREFQIDVTQSFHTSTADSIEWDAGVNIDLTSSADVPVLTGTTPLAWGFSSGGPDKHITINGFRAVDGVDPNGEEFTFVGSEILVGSAQDPAAISTRGRHFIAAALDGPGEVMGFVGVDNPASNFQLEPALGPSASLGRIDLIAAGLTTAGPVGGNGDIVLFGGDIDLSGTFNTRGGSGIRNGGDVSMIAADSLLLDGEIQSGGLEGGDGGDIVLTSLGSMDLNGTLSSANDGVGGAGGDVSLTAGSEIVATNLTIVTGGPLAFDADAGAIGLQADVIELDEFAFDATASGTGMGGGLLVFGRDVTLATSQADPIDVSASGSGDAGGMFFDVSESLDTDGVTLNAANTGTGDGGTIVVTDGPGFVFTADAGFAFDVDAADPGAADGMYIGPLPNAVTPPGPPPSSPGTDSMDLVASLDQIISLNAGEDAPPVAEDAPFGGPIGDGASNSPGAETNADVADAGGQGDEDAAEGDAEDDEEEERLARIADQPTPGASLPPVGSAGVADELGDVGASDDEAESRAAVLADLEENQPEASVAAATASPAKKEAQIPGISLYTRAAERAPLMPRTCDVLAKDGSGSRLLARNPRRRPISSEDWLLAFDRTGDQLIAFSTEPQPPVGSAPTKDVMRSSRLTEIQRAFAEAAAAIRGDRYEDAARRFEAAVDALDRAGDAGGAAQALTAFAQLQFEDGRFERARESLGRAVALAEKAGDPTQIAQLRQRLGNALVGVGDLLGAEEELKRGLGVALDSDDKGAGASMLNDLGNRHAATRDYQSALWAYQQAADLAREVGQVGDEARALAGAARVAVDVSRLEDAWRFVERADALRPRVRSIHARTSLAIHVGHTFSILASVTGDRRADALRRGSAALESALADAEASGDERSRALANLNLGALYKDEQHHSEALYLTRLARKSAESIDAPELTYRAHWQEGQILWSAHRVRDALASHRRAIDILEETKPVPSRGYGATQASFQRNVGGVYRDHVDLLLRSSELATSRTVSRQLVVEARETLEKLKGAELRDYFEDECIASVREGGRAIDSGVAVVHTVVLPDRLELLVSLPGGVERFSSRVSAAKLNKLVDTFRAEVQNPRSTAYRPLSRQLYEIVVAPYSKRLAEAKIETLVFVPDGRLRTLPFVALHDGQTFLGDQYATATTLSLNLLSNPELASEIGAPVLAGVSESVQGFVALDSVDEELAEIQGLGGGSLLLNQAFTLGGVQAAVAQEIPGVLHLATHAVFTGNPNTSFLLTYDGRVGFDELADVVGMTTVEGAPLDLLVLSACETAVGNDRAGLGFTGSAIRAGARSAVGSLWPIADEAARRIMVDFYMNLQSTEHTKAGALREAQAQLRNGERYAHPAYWAPFTLVNDWL